MAFSPSRIWTITGPEIMKLTRSLKKGRALLHSVEGFCFAAGQVHHAGSNDLQASSFKSGRRSGR